MESKRYCLCCKKQKQKPGSQQFRMIRLPLPETIHIDITLTLIGINRNFTSVQSSPNV